MSTEPPITETELVNDAPQELQVIVQQNALQPETAKSLHVAFHPFFAEARNVIEKSRQIVVTDAAQKLEMKLARECRLSLKAIRVAGDKARKELKDESLRKGRAIDGFYSILLYLTETEEKRLQDQEDFVERKEQERKAGLKSAREQILTAIQIDPNLYQLGEMSEETFQQLVEGTKLARAAEADRKRKEEAERIEREAKEAAERERIRQENERLKKEAADREAKEKAETARRNELHATRMAILGAEHLLTEEEINEEFFGRETEEEFVKVLARYRERAAQQKRIEAERAEAARKQKEIEDKARAERDAAEKKHAEERRVAEEKAAAERKTLEAAQKAQAEKARKEREAAGKKAAEEKAAREKLEAEIRTMNEAEAKRIADATEAARKAAAAPDKDRLLTYANAVRALDIPTLSTPDAISIANTVKASRDRFVEWIEGKASAL